MSGSSSQNYEAFLRYHEDAYTYALGALSDGVAMGVPHDGAALHTAVNMMPYGKGLKTVGAPEVLGGLPEGELRGSCYASGLWLFGKGDRLFALDGDSLQSVGGAGLLSSEEVGIYEIDRGFAVVNGKSLFFVDRSLSVTAPDISVPLCFDRVSFDGAAAIEREKPRLFSPYIELVFQAGTGMGNNTYMLPPRIAADASYIRAWFEDTGEEIPRNQVSFDGVRVRSSVPYVRPIRVRVRLSDSEDPSRLSFTTQKPLRDTLSRKAMPSSLSSSAAKLCCVLADSREERCFRLARLATAEDFALLSESNFFRFEMPEGITGLAEYGEGLLVFSRGTIRQCRITLAGGVPQIESSLFVGELGSDMPNSICHFEDKIVFADSRGGIYYLDRYGVENRAVCRHISRNIEEGELGFFSHTEAEYRAACAVCAFGKYYLTVGEITYVWDHTAKPPRAAGGYEDESRMVFSLIDTMTPRAYLAVGYRGIFFAHRDGDAIGCYTPRYADGDEALSWLETAESDLGDHGKKVLLSVTAEYEASGEAMLYVLYDGKLSPAVFSLPPTEGRSRMTVRLPQTRFYECAVRLSSDSAFAVTRLSFRYLKAGE